MELNPTNDWTSFVLDDMSTFIFRRAGTGRWAMAAVGERNCELPDTLFFTQQGPKERSNRHYTIDRSKSVKMLIQQHPAKRHTIRPDPQNTS